MILNNLDLIIPLLKFESEDEFYYLQILQRKKENPELGANSRVIKNYHIKSIDQLLRRFPEIQELCKVFSARASLRLNRRSFYSVGFRALQNFAHVMNNKEYSHLAKCYDRACGEVNSENKASRSWILDIDNPEDFDLLRLTSYIERLEPLGEKVIANIPSISGYHLITKPFNLEKFKQAYPNIDIHKDNPTNLYVSLKD